MRLIMEEVFKRASIHDERHIEFALHITLWISVATLACAVCACMTSCFCSLCTPNSLRRLLWGFTCALLAVMLVATLVTTDIIETTAVRVEHSAVRAERVAVVAYRFAEALEPVNSTAI